MQYVLCFVRGVLVYRIQIEVVELVLVYIGESLQIGTTLCIRTATIIGSYYVATVVILISAPINNSTITFPGVGTTSATTCTVANRAQRSGADDATSIAISAPEARAKLTERRLWRHWVRSGRMSKLVYLVMLVLLLLLVLFLI